MAKATHASDATAAHRRRISGMTRPLMNGVPPSASVSRSTVLAWAVVAAFTSGAEAAASSGSGKRWLNSRVTASGSSPMPSAYARMKARRKMPDGHLETSSRSSPSNNATLIFVLAEIDDRAMCRRSRSRRRRLPKRSSVIGMSGFATVKISRYTPRMQPDRIRVTRVYEQLLSAEGRCNGCSCDDCRKAACGKRSPWTRDHPNDAVAFRKYVELTGRVGRDVGVGTAFA